MVSNQPACPMGLTRASQIHLASSNAATRKAVSTHRWSWKIVLIAPIHMSWSSAMAMLHFLPMQSHIAQETWLRPFASPFLCCSHATACSCNRSHGAQPAVTASASAANATAPPACTNYSTAWLLQARHAAGKLHSTASLGSSQQPYASPSAGNAYAAASWSASHAASHGCCWRACWPVPRIFASFDWRSPYAAYHARLIHVSYPTGNLKCLFLLIAEAASLLPASMNQ